MLLLHHPPTVPPLVRSTYCALKKSFHTLPCFGLHDSHALINIIATIWVTVILNCVCAFTQVPLFMYLYYPASVFVHTLSMAQS